MNSLGYQSGGLKAEEIINIQPAAKQGMLSDGYAIEYR
ncbi:hypothetical protein ACVWW6_000652 [Bradyrhizobium sp. USDA 3311]